MLFCFILLFVSYWNPSFAAVSPGENRPTTETKCGQSNIPLSDIQSKIEQKAAVGNFPWQVITFHKEKDIWQTNCAGALISPRVVLTAAHCFVGKEPKDVVVALGRTTRQWNSSEPTDVKKTVKEIRLHPQYISDISIRPSGHDIAILTLESDVVPSSAIMPACLDLLGADAPHKMHGFVASWARPEDCSDCLHESGVQKYSQVTIQDYGTCFNIIKSINPRLANMVLPDKLCSEGSVVRAGDSGVGLTVVLNGAHYLWGIASNKLQLSEDTTYVMYSSVPHHLEWIKNNLQ